jgi:tetratricopeptide (TPR) repeat protein
VTIRPLLVCLGAAYAGQGRIVEAIELLEKSYRMHGDLGQGFGMLALQYARVGRRADALRLIAEATALSRERYISPFSLATAYLGLGDKDQAFAWLDKAFEERDPKMASLRVDPTFDPNASI